MSEEKKGALKTLFTVNIVVGILLGVLMWRHDLVVYLIKLSAVPEISWDLGWVGISFAISNFFAIAIAVSEEGSLARQMAHGGFVTSGITFIGRVVVLVKDTGELAGQTMGLLLLTVSCYTLLVTFIVKRAGYAELQVSRRDYGE